MSEYPPYLSSNVLGFGVYTSLPDLPDGYWWVQGLNQWLMVRDKQGRFYYVMIQDKWILCIYRRRARLWEWMITLGRLKAGDYFADYRYTLMLPKT